MRSELPPISPSERLLCGPGPSNVDPAALEAMQKPMLGHLDPELHEILLDVVDMSLDQLKQAVALGPEIYAEFTSQFGNQDPSSPMVKQYVEGIRAAGVDHSFVSSDTGQINSVFQPDALAKCAKVLRANGFTEQELAKLFKINPAKILGLTPPQ